jgi:hypothetical protein
MSWSGFGAICRFTAGFIVIGGFLNIAIDSLKRVPERLFKISKCFHKNKQKPCIIRSSGPGPFKGIVRPFEFGGILCSFHPV